VEGSEWWVLQTAPAAAAAPATVARGEAVQQAVLLPAARSSTSGRAAVAA
jgi:hypothetical protein